MTAKQTPNVASEVSAELRTWHIHTLNILLATMSVAATVVAINSLIQAIQNPALWPQTVPFLLAYAILLVLTLVRHLDYRLRAGGLLVIGYAVGVMYLAILGLLGNGMIFLLALPALGVILLGIRSGLAMAGISLLIYVAFTIFASLGWMADWLIIQENTLALSQWLSQGLSFGLILLALVVMQSLFSQAQTRAQERARQAADELGLAHQQLQARSEELNRYTRLLEAVSHISQETTSLLDREELSQRTVHLIAQRLGFDQVAIYLRGEPDQDVVLGAAAKPRSPDQPPEAVIQVIQSGAPQSARFDLGGQGHHELTLPLEAGGQIIGALDVHAVRPAPFSAQESAVLQGMADHLAVAFENARLFTETQASLQEMDALYRHYTVEAWQRFKGEYTGLTHRWQSAEELSGEVWQTLSAQARASGHTATDFDEQSRLHLLAAPVKLRDVPIGVLGFHRPAEAGPWEQEQTAAIEAIAERLAPAAENLRLLDETQRRAARERLLSDALARMRQTLDMDTILRTATREMRDLLDLAEAEVRIGLSPAPGEAPGAGRQASQPTDGNERESV